VGPENSQAALFVAQPPTAPDLCASFPAVSGTLPSAAGGIGDVDPGPVAAAAALAQGAEGLSVC